MAENETTADLAERAMTEALAYLREEEKRDAAYGQDPRIFIFALTVRPRETSINLLADALTAMRMEREARVGADDAENDPGSIAAALMGDGR